MHAPGSSPDDAPILVELRHRLEASDDPAERSVLQIRQALYLARTDRLKETEGLPAEVRAQWEGREDLRVFVWLWLFEGVLSLYRDSLTDGRLRLLQSREAALRGGWRAESELAAAWLAHFAYVDGDYPAMIQGLVDSGLGMAALDETISRSTLTLACALQWFGQDAKAQTWFARARDVARSTGDRAGIMAATANRLMLKLSNNWMSFAFGEPLPHAPEPLREELLGILGYEQISGSTSLLEQNEIATLRLNVIKGDYGPALALTSAMDASQQRRSAPALAMAAVVRAWLQARELDPTACAPLVSDAVQRFQSNLMDDDDAASCWALLSQAAKRAGQKREAQRLSALAEQSRARYRATMEPLLKDLLAIEKEASARWTRN
jgi:hypothetical protein